MKDKKLDKLVEYIRREYRTAREDEKMSSIFSSAGDMQRIQDYESILSKVNEIFGTNYSFSENSNPEDYDELHIFRTEEDKQNSMEEEKWKKQYMLEVLTL